jgi:hypothetical protein
MFTTHLIQHPQQADVFEPVGYTGCGFSVQFPIADNPACTVEDLLAISLDYLTNKKKLSKQEEQALQYIEDARKILVGEFSLSSENVDQTTLSTENEEIPKSKRTTKKKTTAPVEETPVVPE